MTGGGASGGDPRWKEIERIFTAALDAGDARTELLARECAHDPTLRREVDDLLAAHDTQGPADHVERHLQGLRGDGPVAGQRFGKYVILERLGGGGMGLLYAARDERLDRTLALKVLPDLMSLDPDATRRFLLEARAAAMLDHPSICAIHEVAESEDGRLFIAMPLYLGETLADRIARGPMAPPDALALAVTVAQGLAHAHARGIVHRDIKPANIYLLEDGTLKILDFGIAKVADLNITSTGAVLGTLPYMSPEQASGGAVDRRSDLWSLGVVLHEMIAGRRPFEGPGPEAIITAILTEDPPPLSGVRGAVAVNQLIARLLAKDPAERFTDADAAAAALEATLDTLRHGPLWEGGAEGPPIAPEGERRQVTVLTAQVGGYASLVERWAPADVERAMARMREHVAATAGRRGGVLHRFSGESFTCLFGVPTTHEDDVARAAHAARDMHEWGDGGWMGDGRDAPPLGLRSGIAAGSVVIQPDPATRSHRVAGEPLEAAARLAAEAKAGEVRLSSECARALAVAEEPGERRLVTPFAGREREFAQLGEALDRARGGAGQFVTIEAEAGAGKSRLLIELARGPAARDIRLVRAWCRAHHLGAPPYEPFNAALRALLDLGSGPAAALDPAAVAAELAAVVPELTDAVPLVLHLLGAPTAHHPLPKHLEGDHFRRATPELLAAIFTLATQRGPLALILEDWHWADEASHEVLKQLVELAPAYPLAVVVSHRPEHGVSWPEETPRTTIRLGALDASATARLIAALLSAEAVAEELVAAVHERSGGNPFFVEELVHALGEQGAVRVHAGRAELAGAQEELHLPGTIQAVIRARLDRLDASAREVARAASVLGRDFTLSLVRRMVDDDAGLTRAVERLRHAGLIHQARVLPEPAYRFKHILTQEVIYDTLLAHRRRVLHARAGAAIEQLHPARRTELATMLAFHHSRAEQWPEAAAHGREEARQAATVGEFPRALQVMDRVEEWVLRISDRAVQRPLLVDLLLGQERLCETLGHRQRQHEILERLHGILDAAGDTRTLAEVSLRQGDLHVLRRRFDEARVALDRAIELSRAASEPALTRSALRSLGLLCWHAGRSREGLTYLDEALAMDRALGDSSQVARDLYNQSTLLRALGEHQSALRTLAEAREAALTGDDPGFLGYVTYNTAIIHRLMGENDQALSLYREALALYRERSMWLEVPFCASAIGNILMARGEVEGAIEVYREAVAISRRLHHADGLAQSLRSLGTLLAGLGRADDALPCLREAAELFGQLRDGEAERELWARVATGEEGRGAHVDAATAWVRAGELSREAADPAGELEAAGRAARALRDGGDAVAARVQFHAAFQIADRLEEPVIEGELRNAAGILEWRAGRYADALAHYERARAIFRLTGDRRREGLALNSMGATLLCLQRVDEAKRWLEEAVTLNHSIGDELLEAHALATLGDALLAQGAAAEAEARYGASLDLRRTISDRLGEGWMHCRLASTADLRSDAEGASTHRAQAKRIAEELGDDELARACATSQVRTDATKT